MTDFASPTSATYLEARNLSVKFGEHVALRDVSFEVKAGERLCLLGPSGCGKTTSLRIIAGFFRPDSGTVRIAGRDMNGMPPEERNIGILFQSYALFPHLTAYDNIAFGLRMRGIGDAEIRRRVTEALELVQLPRAGGKRPSMLSGGEQQRIAFARAVVIQPSLLLLDEPFSNLDARLRQEMRGELLDLLQKLNIATVMVTHDQEEAMAIADRIVVMRSGTVEQVGPPGEIYERPISLFVARFVGESNLFPVQRTSDGALEIAGIDIGPLRTPGFAEVSTSQRLTLLVRPEKIRIIGGSEGARAPVDGTNRAAGVIERVQYLGHRAEYRVRVGAHAVSAWRLNESVSPFQTGDRVFVEWQSEDARLFPEEAGQ